MPDITYVFTASGADSVVSAFTSIARAAEASGNAAKNAGRSTVSGSRQGARAASASASEQKKAYRSVSREVKKQERQIAASQAASDRMFLRSMQMRQRERVKDLNAAKRSADKIARAEQAASAKVAKNRRMLFRRNAALAGRAALHGVGAAMGGAAMVVGRATRQSIALEDKAARIAIKGTSISDKPPSPTELRREFERTAMLTPGVKAEDVASGVERFVAKTGNLDKAREFQGAFARIGQATGTDIGALGSAAADLFEKFDITSVKQMSDAMAILSVQGKRGAFELEDAAKQFPKIAAAASRFGIGKGVKGLALLGGLTQEARKGTGTGAQAATSVENLFRALTVKSGLIKQKTGVDVFKGDFTKNLSKIVAETAGDKPLQQKIFGTRGVRAVSNMVKVFNDAREKGASMVEAQEKVRQAMLASVDVSKAQAEIDRDQMLAQKTTGAQLEAAWQSIRAAVSESFMPVIKDVVKSLAGLASDDGAMAALKKGLSVLAVAIDTTVWAMRGMSKVVDEIDPAGAKKRRVSSLMRQRAEAKAERDALGLTSKGERIVGDVAAELAFGGGVGGLSPDLAAEFANLKISDETVRKFAELSRIISNVDIELPEDKGTAKAITRQDAVKQLADLEEKQRKERGARPFETGREGVEKWASKLVSHQVADPNTEIVRTGLGQLSPEQQEILANLRVSASAVKGGTLGGKAGEEAAAGVGQAFAEVTEASRRAATAISMLANAGAPSVI